MVTIIEKTPKNPAHETQVRSAQGLSIFTGPVLLALYNAATGRDIKKFATRAKALEQTWKAISPYSSADVRTTPPVLSTASDEQRPAAALTPTKAAGDPVTDNAPSPSRGRPLAPVQNWKAKKLEDGSYIFNMPARTPRFTACGGRRPELVKLLRKRPTFDKLLEQFAPSGETREQRAFNMATAVTCLCHVNGYGVVTDTKGRIDLLEPLS